ncbi:hypothetical protein GGS20DRAFT_538120 [Poronia punctata]|nr:hypothetical protein GGS20DRAFT_538120 [Poronia punctata]
MSRRGLIATAAAVVAATTTTVQALAFPGTPAQATVAAAVVPDPTFYKPTVTDGPSIYELARRADDEFVPTWLLAEDNTCGYISGRAGVAYTCAVDYTCGLYITEGYGAVGCCYEGSDCGVRYDCMDYNQISTSSECDSGCMQDTLTAKCTDSAYPYCATISFFSGISDYYCAGLEISTIQQIYTTYNGQTDAPEWTEYILTDDEASSSFTEIESSSSTDDGDFFPSATTDGFGGSSFTPEPTADNDPVDVDSGSSQSNGDGNNDNHGSKKSSTPVGPIVGGVVGGVGALGLIGLAAFFLIRHNKKNSNAAAANTAATAGPVMHQHQQPPPGNNGIPGYAPYDPHHPQQQQPPPPHQGGWYDQKPAGFVDMTTTPVPVDRNDSTSPLSSRLSDARYSQQSSPAPPQPPHSPTTSWVHHNNNNNVAHAHAHAPAPGGVPPTVHEAGGNPVGQVDYNAHHRGEFHELG